MNILEIENLNFSYNDISIFNNLKLSIKKNSFNFLSGNNSCGKTTLLKIIAGLIPTNNIKYSNKKIDSNKLKNKVSYIDNTFINYGKTVKDELNILFDQDSTNAIKKILKEFNLEDIINKSPNSLSYLTQIKLNIIKGLILKKKIILLDNVFSSFGKKETNNFLKLLKSYAEKNDMTVIISENDTENIFEFDNIILIHDKRVVFNDNYIDEDLFSEIGINLPFVCELSDKLLLYELIKEDNYNLEELVKMIC